MRKVRYEENTIVVTGATRLSRIRMPELEHNSFNNLKIKNMTTAEYMKNEHVA